MKSKVQTEFLQELFYWFHKNPELAYQEFETTKKIREVLEDNKIKILDLNLDTGLVAIIEGAYPGPVIALRGDIDALPILEESGLEYSSCNTGVMHACGHDFHTTVILGTALELEKIKSQIHGTVKIIFQPAEETAGGAEKIVKTNALEDVTHIWGIHSTPMLPTGAVGISEGAVMAAADRFTVEILGKGTHAAYPHEGVDPITIAATIIQELQLLISRIKNPFSPAVISVTHIESGNTWNVIPETAFLEGTVRTLNPEDRELLRGKIQAIVNKTTEIFDAKGTFNWFFGSPAVINDREMTEFARKIAKNQELQIEEAEKALGGEDFSLYLPGRKGAFLRIGTGGAYASHHPKFTVDPRAIDSAVSLMKELAVETLNHLTQNKTLE
ncbi:MAG: amidohydrolase [Clostridiales bacterium]|nr:amidohydrolase [Clostridiales bacterium]